MQRIEQSEQMRLISWCEIVGHRDPRIKRLFHVPNGGKRTKVEAGIFRRMGVRPGVPDLFLPVVGDKGEPGLWIEMKAPGGRPTEHQVEWHAYLLGAGYRVVVAKGWVEAAEAILAYLGHPKQGWI